MRVWAFFNLSSGGSVSDQKDSEWLHFVVDEALKKSVHDLRIENSLGATDEEYLLEVGVLLERLHVLRRLYKLIKVQLLAPEET